MPQKIGNIRTTQTTRTDLLRDGKANQGNGCQKCGKHQESDSKVIASSLYNVKVTSKRGFEVIRKTGKKYNDQDDYIKMYNDLYAAVVKAGRLLNLQLTDMDPYVSGLRLDQAFYIIIKRFEDNILPKGFEYKIDREEDDGDYYFTLCKEVKFPWAWHTFEIKPAVEYLIKRNRKLHDLFIDLMSFLYNKCGITTWWSNGFVWTDTIFWDVEEYIAWNYEFESEEEEQEERAKLNAMVDTYKNGQAREYADLLKSSSKSYNSIAKRVNAFRATNPLIKWMKEAVVFLQKEGCIDDYRYANHQFYEEGGLTIERQVCIIWDEKDLFTQIEGQGIDNEAQQGVAPAILAIPVSKKSRVIDLSRLEERTKWMMELSDLQTSYYKTMQKITK